jgi:hypothetical protein
MGKNEAENSSIVEEYNANMHKEAILDSVSF